MAENVNVNEGTGTTVPISADEVTINAVLSKVQRVKLVDGADGGTAGIAAGAGTAATALRVELPTDGTGVIATVGAVTAITNPVHVITDSGTITAVTAITNALPAGTNAIGKLAANSAVDIGDVDVTSVVPGTAATNLGKAEDGGHTSGDTGVMALGVANTALAAISGTTLDYTPIATELNGRVLTIHAPVAAMVRGNASATDTTSTSVVAASGDAGLKTYITNVQISNTGATTVLVTLQDGSGGTAVGYLIAPAGGGGIVHYQTPLVTTANTALYFAAGGSTTTLYVSAQGYKAP